MSRPFIVVGDKTDHGGTVTSGASTAITGGKPIARIGDSVPCPRCQDPNAVIVSGDQTIIVDDAPVARHGDKTSCGATLLSSQLATHSGGSGSEASSAQKLSAADLTRQSEAENFDQLPPRAKAYVFDQADRAGVFAGNEALETAGDKALDHQTFDNGLEKFTTDDPNAAARAARAQMGLRPYQKLESDQILATDPGAPEASAGGRGVKYKHLSQVDVHGGSWAARFADTRPVEGVAKPAYAPGALPGASASGTDMATVGTGMRTLNNVFQKGVKAHEQGLKQRIDIYQAPDGDKMVKMSNWSINQRTDTLEPTILTKTQVLQAMNKPAVEGLDDQMLKIQKDKLNDFYRANYRN